MKAIRASVALAVLIPLGLALAGCGAVPPPAPAPVPRPAPPPPPPPRPQPIAPAPADWRDAPQTPGTWTWAMEGGRSTARYGLAGGATVASLSCEPGTRTINLWRTGAASGAIPLVVTTTGRRAMVNAAADERGGARAGMPASDSLLDAIAFSRGRFMLEMPGNPALYLPAWPELTRVIEDCRKS